MSIINDPILVIEGHSILPIECQRYKLDNCFGPETADLSIFPADFLEALTQLHIEIDTIRMHAINLNRMNTTANMFSSALRFHKNYSYEFTHIEFDMIEKDWFDEHGMERAVWQTCNEVGWKFGYYNIDGGCAVKLINSIRKNDKNEEFKYYLCQRGLK